MRRSMMTSRRYRQRQRRRYDGPLVRLARKQGGELMEYRRVVDAMAAEMNQLRAVIDRKRTLVEIAGAASRVQDDRIRTLEAELHEKSDLLEGAFVSEKINRAVIASLMISHSDKKPCPCGNGHSIRITTEMIDILVRTHPIDYLERPGGGEYLIHVTTPVSEGRQDPREVH